MAGPLTIEIVGLTELVQTLKNDLPNQLEKEIDGELLFASQEIINRSIRAAPKDTGRLAQGIGPTPIKEGRLEYSVSSNAQYSPYVEFGTGDLVQIPEGLEDYAIQFKGKGIRKINRRPQPFFFPQFFFVKVDLLNKIQDIVDNP